VFKNTFFKHIIVKQPEKIQKIGTLGIHVSGQRNFHGWQLPWLAKFHSQLLSRHLYFEVTIHTADGYLVNCWLYSDKKS
jgi:hypothetical protein